MCDCLFNLNENRKKKEEKNRCVLFELQFQRKSIEKKGRRKKRRRKKIGFVSLQMIWRAFGKAIQRMKQQQIKEICMKTFCAYEDDDGI